MVPICTILRERNSTYFWNTMRIFSFKILLLTLLSICVCSEYTDVFTCIKFENNHMCKTAKYESLPTAQEYTFGALLPSHLLASHTGLENLPRRGFPRVRRPRKHRMGAARAVMVNCSGRSTQTNPRAMYPKDQHAVTPNDDVFVWNKQLIHKHHLSHKKTERILLWAGHCSQ